MKLCKTCGYQLDRKAQKCSWCKTPVKKITPRHYFISALIVFSIFVLLMALSKKKDSPGMSPSREQIPSSPMKTTRAEEPIRFPRKNPAKVYVKKQEIVNLPQPSKTLTPYQTYRAFRKYFKRLNTEIKAQKGMAFFENVEYLDNGVIQVTATDIFLSAPETYKQIYLIKMEQTWLDLREPSLQATVRIVDSKGVLRMEKKRG